MSTPPELEVNLMMKSLFRSDGPVYPDRGQQLLALSGVAAPMLFTLLVIVSSLLRSDYSHLSHTISGLGESGAPNAWIQNVNFVMLGVLTVAFGIGLHRGINGSSRSKTGPVLIVLFGSIGLIGSALFPADPGGTAVTTVGNLHNLASTIGFPSVIAAMWVLGTRMRQDERWRGYVTYSRVNSLVAFSLFLLLGAVFSGAIPSLEVVTGLLQRIFVASIFSWMIMIGLRLLRLRRGSTQV
jgi:hypothetical membrane protein